jgi:hypothetical protein
MPGALVLRTTADGAATTTERMAIRQSGAIQIPNRSAPTIQFSPLGYMDLVESSPGNPAANFGRLHCVDVGGVTHLACLDSAGTRRIFTDPPARAYDDYLTNANITTAIPLDDSIPQSGEGTEILSAEITLKRANSRVRVRFQGWGQGLATDDTRHWTIALFKDSGTDAIAATVAGHNINDAGPTSLSQGILEFEHAPGSVGPHTYKINVGPQANTLRLNGNTSGRLLGGVGLTTLVVEEIYV